MTPRRPKAITFDFFNTLAYHRDGGGRGMRLVEYLRSDGLSPRDWRHEILYEIFDVSYEGDALERPLAAPAASSSAAGRHGALLVARAGAGVPPSELPAGHALAGLDMLPRWLRRQFP